MAGSEGLPRLLLVGGDGHPSGVPRHIRHLSTALTGQAQITVASDINHGGYDRLDGVGHITVPGLQSRPSLPHLVRGWRGLARVLRTQNADIVWLHARLPVILGRVMLGLRLWRPGARTRVVVTYHGLPFGPGHRPVMAAVSTRLEKGLLRACPPLDLVFLTQGQAERMATAMGKAIARHRLHVLPNSSDLGPLPPSRSAGTTSGGRHLVMTGRCGYQKNYPLALRLFAHLPDTFALTLCGAGTDTDRFRAEAAALLPPAALARVRFAGPLRDIGPVLAAADGYLLCSRYEGLPIGALEAFEAGLPLILGQFDGADDIASTHPLALVLEFRDLPEDAARLAELLDRAASDRKKTTDDIQAAWALRWSYEAFTENARALFAQLRGPPKAFRLKPETLS